MPKGLERRYGQGHLHFITCSCYKRLPLLGAAISRNILVSTLNEVRDRYSFALVGYVIMPEHFHLLIGEPVRGTPSTVLQLMKQMSSSRLRGTSAGNEHFGVANSHTCAHQFWTPRFYDFNVWSRTKISEKLQYMHMNPIKRGLVAHPREWIWSSYSFYSDMFPGIVRIDPVS
jgi:putative transposase